MNILMLLIFIGAALVALALVLFAWTVRSETFGQSDRLALMPLSDDAPNREGNAGADRARVASAGVTGAPVAPAAKAEDASSPHRSTPHSWHVP